MAAAFVNFAGGSDLTYTNVTLDMQSNISVTASYSDPDVQNEIIAMLNAAAPEGVEYVASVPASGEYSTICAGKSYCTFDAIFEASVSGSGFVSKVNF